MDYKISIIIPCFNQAHFLRDSLNSVVAQTYKNWECIVVNDGSADDTEIVCLEYCKADARIKYISKENGGLSSARNAGLDVAKGHYIQFLDSDDMLSTNKLSQSAAVANDADVVISNFAYFKTTDGKLIAPGFKLTQKNFCFESILSGWDSQFVFPPHCGLFKYELFANLRFNEALTAREDWLMWLQIYLEDLKTIFIDEANALYRLSDKSMSNDKSLMDNNQILVFRILCEIVPAEFQALFSKKVVDTLGDLLTNYQQNLVKTRESESYRIGNFIVRNLNRFRKHRQK